MMNKNNKIIIYDFDGVICDSVDIKTKAFVDLYSNYSNDIKSQIVQYHYEHGGVSRLEKIKFFEQVILKNNPDSKYLNKMCEKFSKIVKDRVINAKYIEGALSFIKKYADEYSQYICSGTPQGEIQEIIHRKKINKFFKGVFGSPDKKEVIIRRIIGNNKVELDKVLYIGDAISDYHAARECSVRFIGVENVRTIFPEGIDLIKDFNDKKLKQLL